MSVDYSTLCPADRLAGEDEEETRQLQALRVTAEGYIRGHSWVRDVREVYFGAGVADIVAVFLFRITPAEPGVDEELWVIVGDIPPAYLVTDRAPDPAAALRAYLDEMMRWVDAVKQGRAVDALIPLNAPPTRDNALDLECRLKFLRNEIAPRFQRSG